jgi:hypothetical protein
MGYLWVEGVLHLFFCIIQAGLCGFPWNAKQARELPGLLKNPGYQVYDGLKAAHTTHAHATTVAVAMTSVASRRFFLRNFANGSFGGK